MLCHPFPVRLRGGSPGLLAPGDHFVLSRTTAPLRSASPVIASLLNCFSRSRLALFAARVVAFRRFSFSRLFRFACRICFFAAFIAFRAARSVFFGCFCACLAAALAARFAALLARFACRRPAFARLLLASFLSTLLVALLIALRVLLTFFATALLAFARSFAYALFFFRFRGTAHPFISVQPAPPFSCFGSPLFPFFIAANVPLTDQLPRNRLTQQRRLFQCLSRCRVK